MLEDRQGFEPWGRITTPNFLAGSPDKPLWHLSVLFVSAFMKVCLTTVSVGIFRYAQPHQCSLE
jgi:hypothetical protein